MRSVVMRLIHSPRDSLLPGLRKISAVRSGRLLSTDSTSVDEPFKVQEAETVNVPPPPSEKVLVLGGNGFVGSHVCKEALDNGLSVSSISRFQRLVGSCSVTQGVQVSEIGRPLSHHLYPKANRLYVVYIHLNADGKASLSMYDNVRKPIPISLRSGRSSLQDPWANSIIWHQGDLLLPELWKDALNGVTAIISCVGGFGSNSQMYKINGTANINAIRAAAEKGVKRFIYISAADFGAFNYLLKGYYEGKRAAEAELLALFPYGGVVLRPGFIHGTRQVGSMKIPLSVVGSPLEMILQHAKPLSRVPLVGPLFVPPVNVRSVAKVAVRAAIDQVFPPGIVDAYGILRYSGQ